MIWATSGCFLYFHHGHKDLILRLKQLSKIGDRIFIGVNTDQYLREKKGETQELVSLRAQRVQHYALGELQSRIAVVVIDDNLASKIKSKYPEEKLTWVVGEDYENKRFKELEIVDIVVFTKRIGESSSQIEEDK